MLKSQGQSVPPKQVAATIVGKLENTEPFLEKVSVHMWLEGSKPASFPGSSELGMRLSPVLAGYTRGKLLNKAFIVHNSVTTLWLATVCSLVPRLFVGETSWIQD